MHKLILTILTLLGVSSTLMAQTQRVCSPDGQLALDFALDGGCPTYSVTYQDKPVILPSQLGFTANLGNFAQGLTVLDTKVNKAPQHIDYTMNRAKTSSVSKEYNELTVKLQNGKKLQYSIVFRVQNNDIAFRYEIPNQPSRQNGKAFSIRIMDEKTSFRLPNGTTTFLTPQSDAMIGWKGTKPSYEEEYVIDAPLETVSQYGKGWTFPCLFKETHKSMAKSMSGSRTKTARTMGAQISEIWVLISETGVDSRYCASRLSDWSEDIGYKLEFPMAEENSGNGTREPAMALPGATPWRTITVGSTLAPIVETTIPWDYVTPRYETRHDYKFGKGTWSWIVWQDNSICWKDQVEYIQLAKAMGYQYVLIDNWWDNNIGKQKMEELVKYAQSQGVDVFLWYSSSGYWNDIEQGPINIMDNPISRKQYMAWMQKIGVKGIKVDFFGGDKQETMRLYEHILSDADDHGLMVIFHGCTIPRGWERMYPNYVGSEAVLASENIFFQQHFCDVEAQNTALHPFIRNTIGCMEFGGCFMNRHINRGNKGGNHRITTDCHELATCVLFQNPIQNFAITPENLNGTKGGDPNAEGAAAPELCMDFLRQVPTTWDETRFIQGYPGRFVILARRHGKQWYIAGNNATKQNLTITLTAQQLDGILTKGQSAQLYTDNLTTREPEQSTVTFNGKQLTLTLAPQGGFVAVK